MIARAGRISAPTMGGKETLFRLSSARQTSAGYRIAGYKLLSDRDLSLIRANDAPTVTKEKGTPPLFIFYTEHLTAFFCSCSNRAALRRFRGRASTDSNLKAE